MKNKKSQNSQEETVDTTDTVETVEESKDEQSGSTAEPVAPVSFMHTSMVTEQIISSSATDAGEDPRLVKVLIKYPDDFKGEKFFQDGDVKKVSPETAEIFINARFATKVE